MYKLYSITAIAVHAMFARYVGLGRRGARASGRGPGLVVLVPLSACSIHPSPFAVVTITSSPVPTVLALVHIVGISHTGGNLRSHLARARLTSIDVAATLARYFSPLSADTSQRRSDEVLVSGHRRVQGTVSRLSEAGSKPCTDCTITTPVAQ